MGKDLGLERNIVTKIIRQVHDEATRISDSGQRKLRLDVRDRLPEATGRIEADGKEIEALVARYVKELREKAPNKPETGKAVVRRSLVSRIASLFEDTFPFGS